MFPSLPENSFKQFHIIEGMIQHQLTVPPCSVLGKHLPTTLDVQFLTLCYTAPEQE